MVLFLPVKAKRKPRVPRQPFYKKYPNLLSLVLRQPRREPGISPPQCHRHWDLGFPWDHGLWLPLNNEEPPPSNGMVLEEAQWRVRTFNTVQKITRSSHSHTHLHGDTRAVMPHSHPSQPARYSQRPNRKPELSLQPATRGSLPQSQQRLKAYEPGLPAPPGSSDAKYSTSLVGELLEKTS